jgi:hypothetical protein
MLRCRQIAILAVLLVAVACCLVALLAVANRRLVVGWYDNLVLGNKVHFLSCDDLPSLSEVEQGVAEHQDTIQKIERVNPGFVWVEVAESCSGKADMLIWFGTRQDRLDIEEIIGDDRFFGIPYRMYNH